MSPTGTMADNNGDIGNKKKGTMITCLNFKMAQAPPKHFFQSTK